MQHPVGVRLGDYHEALATRSQTLTTVRVLTAEHKAVSGITPVVLEGSQINFPGAGAEVSRTLQLNMFDPTHALQLDSDSPADGAVYPDRFIQVTQTTTSPLLSTPAVVRAFTGPLVKFSRNGDTVQIEAQGKEQRARTDVPSLTCKKGMNVADAIEKIMRERCGEHLFAFPKGVTDRLPKDVVVGHREQVWPWTVCLRLARSIGMQLFYDGRGVLVLRDVPKHPLIELLPTGPVSVEYDWASMFNRVVVKGHRKVKATKSTKAHEVNLEGDAVAGPKHPLNPTRMGRNGVPWRHTLFIEDTKISTNAQADKVADEELARVLTQAVKLTANVVPVWHLDPRDRVLVGDEVVSLEDATFSLDGGDATVGETQPVRRPHR